MKARTRKVIRIVLASGAVALGVAVIFAFFGNDIARAFESDAPSRSVGSTEDGSLVNGKRLPTSGANFHAYGRLPIALGRNSLHGRVRVVVVAAYARVEELHPKVTFVYGECSRPGGGPLSPHKTHANGLSIDFMVPVATDAGPVVLRTHIGNRYGYGVHFDEVGWCKAQGCRIDFDAMAAHLDGLADAADAEGLRIRRVIFAPDLQPHLFATEEGKRLKRRLTFSERPSWVRHDEHYHVDFDRPDKEDAP